MVANQIGFITILTFLIGFHEKDYMDNIHGKEISLQYVTVKVPGQKPRGSRSIIPASNGLNDGISNLSLCNYVGKDKKLGDKSSLSTFDANKDSGTFS